MVDLEFVDSPSKFLTVRLTPIEVEFLVILGVEVVFIGEEGSWVAISDSTYVGGFPSPSIGFMIFPPPASMEVDPFDIVVGRECAEGHKFFENVDLDMWFYWLWTNDYEGERGTGYLLPKVGFLVF